MSKNIQNKIEQEKETIEFMIRLYCRKHHDKDRKKKKELCSECQELLDYTYLKIDRCPKMEEKTFCATCNIHCYPKVRREQVRQVMKWAGPRMILYNPRLAIKHVLDRKRTNDYSPFIN